MELTLPLHEPPSVLQATLPLPLSHAAHRCWVSDTSTAQEVAPRQRMSRFPEPQLFLPPRLQLPGPAPSPRPFLSPTPGRVSHSLTFTKLRPFPSLSPTLVLSSCCTCYTLPQTWQFKITQIFPLAVPEIRSLSRVHRAVFLVWTQGRVWVVPFPAPGGHLLSLARGPILQLQSSSVAALRTSFRGHSPFGSPLLPPDSIQSPRDHIESQGRLPTWDP